MRKILFLLALLLWAQARVAAQTTDIVVLHPGDTINSDDYLKRQGLLQRAQVYRALFATYKSKAELVDSVVMQFTAYDPDEQKSGVEAVYTIDHYTINVTLSRLRNDTSIYFIYYLNRELYRIKLGYVGKTFTKAELFAAGFELWTRMLDAMGEEQFTEYVTYYVKDRFEREEELQNVKAYFYIKSQVETEK